MDNSAQPATRSDANMIGNMSREQFSDKLKEFADTKKSTLPSAPDEKTQETVKKLKNLSGAEFDCAYVQTGGAIGHENLDAVMSKVETEAEDADLLQLVTAVHPLAQLHLQVSQAVLEKFPA